MDVPTQPTLIFPRWALPYANSNWVAMLVCSSVVVGRAAVNLRGETTNPRDLSSLSNGVGSNECE